MKILKKPTRIEINEKKNRDLSELSGSWNKEEYDDFSAYTGIFDNIDEEA